MGGHGGLNILPQKRWNVYNYDNREKVRQDEEAAAKEEHLKREQSRRRDSEVRLEKLREARGIPSRISTQVELDPSSASNQIESSEIPLESESESKHINLFEGIRIFDIVKDPDVKESKRKGKFADDKNRNKKVKKEEVRVVGPEDEKYRMGYGIVGKGVKLPWYMEHKVSIQSNEEEDDDEEEHSVTGLKKTRNIGGKKTMEELRAERLNREKLEKERVKALLSKSRKASGFSSMRR